MLNSAAQKIVLLINLKLLTIANSFLLNIAEHEIFSANRYENANYRWHFENANYCCVVELNLRVEHE